MLRAVTEGHIAGMVTLGVVFVSVTGLLRMADATAKQHLRDGLGVLAAAAATTVDPVAHARMTDPALQNGPEYQRAVAPLREILRTTPGVTYIYTAVLDGDKVRFVLDAATPGDHDGDGREDQAKIWEEYINPEPIIYEALLGNDGRGAIISSGEPYLDAWGSFLTGYAPFHNADGTLAGIVGVDMRAERYIDEAAARHRAGLLGLIPGAMLSAVVAAVVASIRRNQLLAVRTLEHERRSARRLALIVERTQNAVIVTDALGDIEWVNAGFERLTGYTLDEARGKRPGALLQGPETDRREVERVRAALQRRERVVAEILNYSKSGREYWLRMDIEPVFEDGVHTGFMAVQSDITERVLNEQLLERTNEIARIGGWEVDLRAMKPVWSRMVKRIHGVPDDYVPDMTSAIEFYAPEHREAVATTVRRAIEAGEPFEIEAELVTASGERIWVQSSGHPVFRDGRCVRLTGVLRDITELRRAQDHLRELSETDRLTGLPNRVRFGEELRRAIREARADASPIAVLFFDFDRFKQVNDAMGHAAGDALLRSIAGRFRDSLLPGDAVARFGGDEFVVVLRSVRDVHDAAGIAERLVSIFSAPHSIFGTSVLSTASAGLAYFDGRGDTTPDQLLADADTALHEAKESGKNRCRVFDDFLRDSVRRRHEVELALRLDADTGALTINYAPVASLESGEIAGSFACIHCDAPAAQRLSQRELFAAIDDTGTGLTCFLAILRQACADAADLASDDAERVPWIALPMTANTLAHPMLHQSVRRVLRKFNRPTGTLRVAVPEAALCDPRHDLSGPLRALRALGLGVVVQDFGGGAASLTGLKDRPIDAICLDPALVLGLPADRAITAILNAALTLANNLGIEAIAAGVDNVEQVTALQALNCGYGVGPALGNPTGLDRARRPRAA